jgi:hypothetical protein
VVIKELTIRREDSGVIELLPGRGFLSPGQPLRVSVEDRRKLLEFISECLGVRIIESKSKGGIR